MAKKVLVTGGTGFIGSHLANYLRDKGYFVRVADAKPKSECYLPLKADEVREADLRILESAFQMTKDVDWVFNLAANMGGIGFITEVGADIMHDNALININMMEACRKNNAERIFYSSSACVYPAYRQTEPKVEPLKEEHAIPAEPDMFYGWEKLFTEKLMEAYKKDYSMHIRIARFHNIYGPYGTYKGGREKAPAALCRKVAEARDGDTITVWGDGKQTRSFLYIDDALDGIYRLMQSNYDKPLNIGSDELISIDRLADIIIEASGKTIKKVYDLKAPQGVRGRNADLTLVNKTIGWKPRVTYREGLDKTYRWIEGMVKNAHNS
jgi:nucleoside-diphosphate-sugar epimerase